MAKVELYQLENDGSQKVVVECELVDSFAVCKGDTDLVETLANNGIRNYAVDPPVPIFPSDGKVFLEQMKYNFKSGYLTASDVIEE